MTAPRTAPPLPPPQHHTAAAAAVASAAKDAACAWAQPLHPAAHSRAVSQLYSVLRDLAIAASGLAAYQVTGPPDPAAAGFAQHVGTGSGWLHDAWQRLDGVLAAEGISPPADPDEPGAVLCQAARGAIVSWRQPAWHGSRPRRHRPGAHHRHRVPVRCDHRPGQLPPPRRLAIGLQTAGAAVAEAIAYFTAAIQPPADPASWLPDSGQ